MPATKPLNPKDGASRIGDPSNYVSTGGGAGPSGAGRYEENVVRIFQIALASAITSAALKSGSAR